MSMLIYQRSDLTLKGLVFYAKTVMKESRNFEPASLKNILAV